MTEYSESDLSAASILITRALPELAKGLTLEDALKQVMRRDAYHLGLMQRYPEIRREVCKKIAKAVYDRATTV